MVNQIVKITLLILVFGLYAQMSQAQSNSCSTAFQEIRVSGNIQVELLPASRSVLEFVQNKCHAEWAVKAGKLMIRHLNKSDAKVVVKVYYNQLNKIVAAGGAELSSDQPMANQDLEFLLINNASADLNIESSFVDVRLFSESRLELAGAAEHITYRVVSESKLLAGSLTCHSVKGVTEQNGVANINGRSMEHLAPKENGQGSTEDRSSL